MKLDSLCKNAAANHLYEREGFRPVFADDVGRVIECIKKSICAGQVLFFVCVSPAIWQQLFHAHNRPPADLAKIVFRVQLADELPAAPQGGMIVPS